MNRQSTRLRDFDYTSSGAYFVTICSYQREHVFATVLEDGVQLSNLGAIVLEKWNAIPEHFWFCRTDEFVIMPNHVHGILWLRDSRSVSSFPVGAQHVAPLHDDAQSNVNQCVAQNSIISQHPSPHGDAQSNVNQRVLRTPILSQHQFNAALSNGSGDSSQFPVGAQHVAPLHANGGLNPNQRVLQTSKLVKQYQPIPEPRLVVANSLGAIVRSFKAAATKQAREHDPDCKIWQRNYHDHIIRNDDDLNRIRTYIQTNPHNWQHDLEATSDLALHQHALEEAA